MFVLALFIGFCVVFGFTKTKKTAGGSARVVKSLDERISHQPMIYLLPGAPRGPDRGEVLLLPHDDLADAVSRFYDMQPVAPDIDEQFVANEIRKWAEPIRASGLQL